MIWVAMMVCCKIEKMQKIIFAAGCFWSVQHKLDNLNGVLNTKAVYAGGEIAEPSYQEVCSGKTGHAEAVYIEFDEHKIPLKSLLDLFFSIHDATQLNRQGPDVGTQYRSAVFCFSKKHLMDVETYVSELNNQPKYIQEKIQTEITMATTFFDAEEFHQKYYRKQGF